MWERESEENYEGYTETCPTKKIPHYFASMNIKPHLKALTDNNDEMNVKNGAKQPWTILKENEKSHKSGKIVKLPSLNEREREWKKNK